MRLRDPQALRQARLLFDECAACGRRMDSLHHVVQKSSPHFGDDTVANLVGICGSGTSGCHGALHGSPYVYAINPSWRTGLHPDTPGGATQRRDAEWVGRRIGEHLAEHRPDVLAYVEIKLGHDAGWVFLERFYYLREGDIRR